MTEQQLDPAAATPPPDLECRQIAGLIAGYLDGALTEAACDRLYVHLGGCAPCSREFFTAVHPKTDLSQDDYFFCARCGARDRALRVLPEGLVCLECERGKTDCNDALAVIAVEERAKATLTAGDIVTLPSEDIERIIAARDGNLTPAQRREVIQRVLIGRRRRSRPTVATRRPVRPCTRVRRYHHHHARSGCARSPGGSDGDGDCAADIASTPPRRRPMSTAVTSTPPPQFIRLHRQLFEL